MVRTIFIALFLCSSLIGFAQNMTNSPFSRYGLGEEINQPSAAFLGMANTSVALADSATYNMSNPASYSFYNRYRPVFNTGFIGSVVNYSSANGSYRDMRVNFRNIALGLPISKKVGLSFGLTPFSTTGYSYKEDVYIDGFDSLSYNFEGTGGINKAYAGIGVKLFEDENNILSLGANGSYMFGTSYMYRYAEYNESLNFFNYYVERYISMSDFNFDLGLLYRTRIKKNNFLSFGATYQHGFKMNADERTEAMLYQGSFEYRIIADTIEAGDPIEGQIHLPKKMSFGFALELDKKWVISAQLNNTQWSAYKEDFGTVRDSIFTDERSLSMGVSYLPGPQFTPNQKYFKSISYRVGGYYSNGREKFDNTNISEYGVGVGLRFPLLNSNSMSSINFGAMFGVKGTEANGLIKESFMKYQIGFTFTPYFYDVWFRKKKYD